MLTISFFGCIIYSEFKYLSIKKLFIFLYKNEVKIMVNPIYAAGNGKVIAYLKGADIFQLMLPCYTAPTLFELINKNDYITDRIYGDIYIHKNEKAELKDITVSNMPVFMRNICGKADFSIKIHDYVDVYDISNRYGMTTLLLKIKQGTPVYNTYPLPEFIYCALVLRGDFIIEKNNKIYNISINGKGLMTAAGGFTYSSLIENLEYALELDFTEAERTRHKDWENFFNKSYSNIKKSIDINNLPDSIPNRELLLETIESTMVSVRVQQDSSGGEIAGYPYHLGYVRDNYGVMRGMLAMGMINEAVALFKYFNNEYLHTGFVANAQGLGFFGTKHVHENDDSEITGYLTLMLTDILPYLNEEDSVNLIKETYSMVIWAIKAQCEKLIDNMLPFNGDETYIAGGILPRDVMNHGSSEATLLFIEGALRAFEAFKKYDISYEFDIIDKNKITEIINKCKASYRNNFMRGNILITNNPIREMPRWDEMPRFRHGVCQGGCGHFGWSERIYDTRYICPNCQTNDEFIKNRTEPNTSIYILKPVMLMPYFINSEIIVPEDLKESVIEMAKDFDSTGTLPSRPEGSICLGYDYGLALRAMSGIDEISEIAWKLYSLALKVAGDTHVWSEYFNNNEKAGTFYRPWESAINIEGILIFIKWFINK